MKQPIRYVLRLLLRLLILWVVDAVAMFITVALLPGVTVTGATPGPTPTTPRRPSWRQAN